MKQIVAKIVQSPSARNVGKLLSANVIAQAIGILIYPILTRLYSPEDFGLLSLFTSIGGVFALIVSLDWYNAIVLPKTDEQARPIVHISLIAVGVTTVMLLFSLPFASPIASLFKLPELASYYWLMPLYVLLLGLWNVLNYWYIRRKAYGRISGYQVSQSLCSAGFKAGFGGLGLLQGGLIFSTVLAPFCALLISVSLSFKQHLRQLLSWDKEACRQAAVTYANFPKYSLPHSLVNNIAGQLPVLLLTPFFSAREVGFWSIALLLSYVPISTITRALYQVLYQKVAEWVNDQQPIAHLFRHLTKSTLYITIPLFTALWFVLPTLTAWLLGEEWRVAGEYIRWLLPWLICNILFTTTNFLFDVFGKQKAELGFEVLLFVLRLGALIVGIVLCSFEAAIICYAIASAVGNILPFLWTMRLVNRYERG